MIGDVIYKIQNEYNIAELELILRETKAQIKSIKKNKAERNKEEMTISTLCGQEK